MTADIKTLYIEVTSECNLACAMCSRNYWEDETIGSMGMSLFGKVLNEIPPSVERVFFGGIGEPLFHPDIIDMIRQVKAKGHRCELITNGTLLDETMCRNLIQAGLDMLWVSLDNMHDAAHAAGSVLDNILRFKQLRSAAGQPGQGRPRGTPRIGVAFVLMKSNLTQLEELIQQARTYGIDEIKTTHLLPYTAEMEHEICYQSLLPYIGTGESGHGVRVELLPSDHAVLTQESLVRLMVQRQTAMAHMAAPENKSPGYCRFVQEGTVFVRWDGEVCPCMSLLHTNVLYQQGHQRRQRYASFGNVKETPLQAVWQNETYTAFRERVAAFEFSPCASCASCDLFDSNEEDCTGSPFPTCGHCLWAYGLIQCP